MFLFSGCDNKLKEAHSHVIPQTHTHTHTHTHTLGVVICAHTGRQSGGPAGERGGLKLVPRCSGCRWSAGQSDLMDDDG